MNPILWLAVLVGSVMMGCAAHDYRRQGDAVILVLRKPHARQVVLYTSLDQYAPRLARPVGGGWEVALPAAQPFRYFYRVDGVLVVPDCAFKEKDDLGGENCLFEPNEPSPSRGLPPW